MKEESFAYQAAHDLRAPLMSVKGLLNLIRQDTEKKNLDYYFNLLETSIDKMSQSINDIISYTKSGKSKISVEEIRIKKVIDDALQSLQFMKGAEQVRIEQAISDTLTLIADYKVLLSVFSNIISNAIRYRDPEKESYLKITARDIGTHIQIEFEDNGIGIEPASHEKIFEKFFQDNPEHEGSGLGLYMVKNSVQRLGGTIRVESVVQQGSKFILQIPTEINSIQSILKYH